MDWIDFAFKLIVMNRLYPALLTKWNFSTIFSHVNPTTS